MVAETLLSAAMFGGSSNVATPVLDADGDYQAWKKDVHAWCQTTNVPRSDQGLAVFLNLPGSARQASSKLTLAELNTERGVHVLMEHLDSVFLRDELGLQLSAVQQLFTLRRREETTVASFVEEFDSAYKVFENHNLRLTDTVAALTLLGGCCLKEDETEALLSTMRTPTYDNVKCVLRESFNCVDNTADEDDLVDKTCEVMNTKEFTRSSTFIQGADCAPIEQFADPVQQRRSSVLSYPRKVNRRNRHGNISCCFKCGSKFHWARACSHRRSRYCEPGKSSVNKGGDDEGSEFLNVSMFIGYSNSTAKSSKLSKLVSDCSGCALLDSGCSRTVCGKNWLEDFKSKLTDYDRSRIVEKESDASFTFGDGASVPSLMNVILPCYILGNRAEIETDVVECDVPLLLSKKAMKKGKMCIDFEKDTALIGGKSIKLSLSSCGHYLMPLSL